jgi:lipopolysaccharide transport system ATP-binding protein
MSVVVATQSLSKRYRLGVINRRYLYRDLQTWFAKVSGRPDPNAEVDARVSHNRDGVIWALDNLDLEIHDGDVVGIIGKNGSGKSTLLKILSRITSPTKGKAMIRGRVASLLEVGTGFHPELTGRDNVYLNGSILGMPKSLIDSRFDDIVDFAGVSDFIDTPVKRYSSGMRVRLAFAVAAHLEPDILIVDEVLAVGDAEFQKKCLGRIGEAAKSGRTILFVSHNPAAVENLCTKGIVLNNGKLAFSGNQKQALEFYARSAEHVGETLSNRDDRRGTGEIRVTEISLKDRENRPTTVIQPGAPLAIVMRYVKETAAVFPNLIVSLTVKTHLDVILFHVSNHVTGDSCAVGGEIGGNFVCELKDLRLLPGNYRVDYRIASQALGARLLDAIDGAAEFEVVSGDFYSSGHLPPFGLVMVPARWSVQNVADMNQQL